MNRILFKVFFSCFSVLLLCWAAPEALFAQDCRQYGPKCSPYRNLRPTRCDGRPVTDKSCPVLETTFGFVDNVCAYVSSGAKDPNPMWPQYKFKYQRIILEASRVEPTDTPEIIQKKVSAMWPLFQDYIACTWEIPLGSFLKYGLTSSGYADTFFFDIVRNWKVPLNDIDPADGKTLLDYLDEKAVLHKTSVLGPKLRFYHDRVRAEGAKYKSEL